MASVITLYAPGTSVLHRVRPEAKLLGLILIAIAMSLAPKHPASVAALLGVVALGYGVAGFRLRTLWGQLRPLRWIVVMIVVTQLLFLTPADALLNTVRVVSVVAVAGLLTLTTRSQDLLDTIERALRPLARWGVDPVRIALTLTLTISMVPVVAGFAAQIREAQQARGARLGLRAIVPLLVMSLRHADDVADALTARGVD